MDAAYRLLILVIFILYPRLCTAQIHFLSRTWVIVWPFIHFIPFY